MTQHLSPEEVVDLVDNRRPLLDAGRAAHARDCESCRQQVRELREIVREAGDLTVPEPSPLYWEHASKRVAEAVSADARSRRAHWWDRVSLAPLTTAVTTATIVLGVVLAVSFLRGLSDRPTVGSVDGASGGDDATRRVAPAVDAGSNEPADWVLLLTMTDTIDWADGDVELWLVGPEAISRAVFELNPDERQVLAELLEAEGVGL